jgi:ABC-type molybdate transport system substrate-binding protein
VTASAWAQEPVRLYAAGSLRAALQPVVPLPEALAVGADYGITVVQAARPEAAQCALFVLSVPRQEVPARYGFTPLTLPRKEDIDETERT